MASLFGVTMLANLEAYQAGHAIPYMWTDNSFGAFVWFDAIGVAIAILWQSRNKYYREVAKLGIFPMVFNIGEPVMYGLPIVLNPIMFIPYVLIRYQLYPQHQMSLQIILRYDRQPCLNDFQHHL